VPSNDEVTSWGTTREWTSEEECLQAAAEDYQMLYKLLPAKVNQMATRLPGHCEGPACSQQASGPLRCLCY